MDDKVRKQISAKDALGMFCINRIFAKYKGFYRKNNLKSEVPQVVRFLARKSSNLWITAQR